MISLYRQYRALVTARSQVTAGYSLLPIHTADLRPPPEAETTTKDGKREEGKKKTLCHSSTNCRSYTTFTFSSAFPRLIRR